MSKPILKELWGEYADEVDQMKLGQIITIPAKDYQKLYHSALSRGRKISRRAIEGNKDLIACKRIR